MVHSTCALNETDVNECKTGVVRPKVFVSINAL